MDDTATVTLPGRIRRIFEQRFVPRARAPESAATVDAELEGKIAGVARRSDRHIDRLLAMVRELAGIWARRDKLERRQLVYLAAALLYFINPFDAVPDLIPGLGYADDLAVVAFVVRLLRRPIGALRERVMDHVAEHVVGKGRQAVVEIADEASALVVPRSIAAVTIGLWGMTTAAAVSLAVVGAAGQVPPPWVAYVVVTAALVATWNVAIAVRWVRHFRSLEGDLQGRLVRLAAARVGARELALVGAPVAALVALAVARVVTASP